LKETGNRRARPTSKVEGKKGGGGLSLTRFGGGKKKPKKAEKKHPMKAGRPGHGVTRITPGPVWGGEKEKHSQASREKKGKKRGVWNYG